MKPFSAPKSAPQVCPKADLDPTKASALNVVNIGGVFVVSDFVRQLLRFWIVKTQQVCVLVSATFLLFDFLVPGLTVWPGLRCPGGCGGVLLEGTGTEEGVLGRQRLYRPNKS